MQQPTNANPVQVVVIAHPGMIDKQIKYRNMKTFLARQLIGLGIVQLLIGILCIIFQGVAVGIYVNYDWRTSYGENGYYNYPIDFVGHGFWNGIMFLITGPFGIAGGARRNRCQVVAFNVLSILSAVFATCLLSIAIPGAIAYATQVQRYCWPTTSRYGDYYYYDSNCDYVRTPDNTGTAMEAMMAILALIEGIVAIWSSAICCTIGACCCSCGGSCCCPPSPLQNQFLMTGQTFPGQQQTFIVNQQQPGSNQQPQMWIPNQPPPYLTNSPQPMFSPIQQQPFVLNPQQQIISLDPRQHLVQYNPHPATAPSYSDQQPSVYTALTPASKNQGSYTDLHTGGRNTANSGDATSPYYETSAYDNAAN